MFVIRTAVINSTRPLVVATLLSFAGGALAQDVPVSLEPFQEPALANEDRASYVRGELLVAYVPGVLELDKERVRAAVGATSIEDITTEAMRSIDYGEM